jgi:hypothetical protein
MLVPYESLSVDDFSDLTGLSKLKIRQSLDETCAQLGMPYTENITKRLGMHIATRCDAVTRDKLIDFYESGGRQSIPQDYASALRLAADTHEQLQLVRAEKAALLELKERQDRELSELLVTFDQQNLSDVYSSYFRDDFSRQKDFFAYVNDLGWIRKREYAGGVTKWFPTMAGKGDGYVDTRFVYDPNGRRFENLVLNPKGFRKLLELLK